MDDLNQKISQLHSAAIESQRRYTYLLIAVAASAIALTLKNTENESLDWFMLPVGLAAIFWGLSFYMGLRHLRLVERILKVNIMFLDFERKYLRGPIPRDRTKYVPFAPTQENIEFHNKMKDDIDDVNSKSAKAATWQFRFLLYGVFSYIVWHVIRLYVKTYCLT